jgi:predicted transcriptional regulator
MGTVNLMLPDALHERVLELADKHNVSVNLFVATALADKISVLLTEEYLADREQKRHASPVWQGSV